MTYPSLQESLDRYFDLKVEDMATFETLFDTVHLQKGEHWVTAGTATDSFLVIASGLLRIYFVDQQGHENVEGFYDSGMMLGHLSGAPEAIACPYSVQALEDSTVYVTRYPRFSQYASDKPDVLDFEVKFLRYMFMHISKREAHRLLKDGEEKYRWFRQEYGRMLERIPQYQIASFLNLTPVSLSRIKSKMHAPK